MIKKLFIYCIFAFGFSYSSESKTNPFAASTIKNSTISFKDSTLITDIFKICSDNTDFKDRNFTSFIFRLQNIYAWLYYIDRGAVQEAKKK
ncbi:MAG TPA: hypothetical protein VL201_03180 [Patescibacteria group bacterium]|jgi:hypothetical protein|nr:hypothetical protein [Patescibacteria group bacterium]